MGTVVVVGSINVDHVVRVRRLPNPGETVLGSGYARHLGGKGANQAVAAARLGAEVIFVGAAGREEAGEASVAALAAEGIDCSHVGRIDQAATGAAVIVVDDHGENQIAVAPGANLQVDSAAAARVIRERVPDVVATVLEVPMAVVLAASRAAVTAGSRVVVNPAPAMPLPAELLAMRPILTPNDGELALIASEHAGAPFAAARELLDRGAAALLVTGGNNGVLVITPEVEESIPAERTGEVVDATGAGDTFAGALAVFLSEGQEIVAAARAANAAAGLSVLKEGARSGMPNRAELEEYLASR